MICFYLFLLSHIPVNRDKPKQKPVRLSKRELKNNAEGEKLNYQRFSVDRIWRENNPNENQGHENGENK